MTTATRRCTVDQHSVDHNFIDHNSGKQTETSRILCIDDDPGMRELLNLRLGHFNVEIEQAYFGEQGYWKALQEDFDLIISDFVMPQGDGVFVVETIRQNEKTREVPVIMLTGKPLNTVRRETKLLGIDAYLQKPVEPIELIQTVISLLRLKTA